MLDLLKNPFATMNQLRREIDSLFEDLGPRWTRGFLSPVRAFPPLNIWDDADWVYAEAELPGVCESDLEIFAVGNELTIKGRRKPLEGEHFSYHQHERDTGDFCRVVTLPMEIDADKVEACLRNGILSVKMAKSAAEKAKKIEVKTV